MGTITLSERKIWINTKKHTLHVYQSYETRTIIVKPFEYSLFPGGWPKVGMVY